MHYVWDLHYCLSIYVTLEVSKTSHFMKKNLPYNASGFVHSWKVFFCFFVFFNRATWLKCPLKISESNIYQINYSVSKVKHCSQNKLSYYFKSLFSLHILLENTHNNWYHTNVDEFYFCSEQLVQFFWSEHSGTNPKPTEIWKGSHRF